MCECVHQCMCECVHMCMWACIQVTLSRHLCMNSYVHVCIVSVCLSVSLLCSVVVLCCRFCFSWSIIVFVCLCLSLFVSVCLLLGCCSLLSLLFLLVPVCVCWCLSLLKGVLFYYYSASFMHACIGQVQSLQANQVFSIATLSGGCTS